MLLLIIVVKEPFKNIPNGKIILLLESVSVKKNIEKCHRMRLLQLTYVKNVLFAYREFYIPRMIKFSVLNKYFGIKEIARGNIEKDDMERT